MIQRYHVVKVDGEEVRLRYTVGGIRAAQAAAGKPLVQLLAALITLDLDACTYLLRAARMWEVPQMTEADAEALLQRWIDAGLDAEEISQALMQTAEASGVLKAVPAGEEEKGPNGQGRAARRKSGSAKRTSGARASASPRGS